MKELFNPDYIEYKVFFIASAFKQSINKNLTDLFITVNDRFYFPKFICFDINYYSLFDEVYIELERINDIVCEALYLIQDKCDEIEF